MGLGQEGAELFGQVEQDGAGLEHAGGRFGAAVQQGRDLGVGIDLHETTAELIALEDIHQPGVVLGIAMTGRQELLEQDGDLLPVRRTLRIQLQRVLSDGELTLESRTGGGAVDACKLAAIAGLRAPHFLRHIAWRLILKSIVCHGHLHLAGQAGIRGRRGGSDKERELPTGRDN